MFAREDFFGDVEVLLSSRISVGHLASIDEKRRSCSFLENKDQPFCLLVQYLAAQTKLRTVLKRTVGKFSHC